MEFLDWRYVIAACVLVLAGRDLFNAYQRNRDEKEKETKGGESP